MSRKATRSLLAAALVAGSVYAGAACAAWLALYPVHGIFYDHAAAANGKAYLNPEFLSAFNGNLGEIHYFETAFKTYFPNAVSTITEESKYRTYAVSVQIVRASDYRVNKHDGTVDVHLPLTISLYFTNVLTGEVIYSVSKTGYGVLSALEQSLANDSEAANIRKIYQQNFNTLLVDALKEAQAKFHPFSINARAVDQHDGLLILNKGIDAGIAKNDSLKDGAGHLVQVIHSGRSYAVAVPELGTPGVGAVLGKDSVETVADIKKPRVLVLSDTPKDGMPPDLATRFFADNLGSQAAFTLLPIDRSFNVVRKTISQDTGISQTVVTARELPDFFIRLKVLPPTYYELPTNLSYKTQRFYKAIVLAELLDRSGRVLYAAEGDNRTSEAVTSGITFDVADKLEIATKNALLDLAKKFAREVRFRHIQVPVTDVSQGQIYLADRDGALAVGASPELYRNLGHIAGTAEDVLAPTWDINVVSASSGNAIAGQTLAKFQGAPAPARGDFVAMDTAGTQGAGLTQRRFTLCGVSDNVGTFAQPDFDAVAGYTVARYSRTPYYDRQVANAVRQVATSSNGFRRDIHLTLPQHFSECIEPAYKIDLAARSCGSAGGVCTQNLHLVNGLRIKTNGQVTVRKGLEQNVGVPVMQPYESSMLQSELDDRSLSLLPGVVQSLNNPTP